MYTSLHHNIIVLVAYILVDHLEECDPHSSVVGSVHVLLRGVHLTPLVLLCLEHLINQLPHITLNLLLAPGDTHIHIHTHAHTSVIMVFITSKEYNP